MNRELLLKTEFIVSLLNFKLLEFVYLCKSIEMLVCEKEIDEIMINFISAIDRIRKPPWKEKFILFKLLLAIF